MAGSWWFRFSMIIAAFLGSLYVLAPTLLMDRQAELSSRTEELSSGVTAEEDAVPESWWRAALPDTALVLGLDLQGGIDLTLDVDIDEALRSSVARDIPSMESFAEDEGVKLGEIAKVRGAPSLDFQLESGEKLKALQGFMGTRYRGYSYSSSETRDGITWHRFTLTDEEADRIAQDAIEQAVEMLRTRVNETGVKEPNITRKGNRRINIQLPGVDNLETAKTALSTTAVLEFMLVDEQFSDEALGKAVQAARDHFTDDKDYADDDLISEWLVDTGRIGRNNRILWQYEEDEQGDMVKSRAYAVIDQIVLTGDDINDAQVSFDPQTNRPYVALEFKPQGGKVFAEFTGAHVKERFAIVLDGKLRSAPVINERIGGGRASISMGAVGNDEAMKDAEVLSLVLRTGALPAPVSIGEVRMVGPSLGADSIAAGREAVVIGFGLVIFVMLIYYRKLGIVADIALILNVFFVMALLAGLGATLTLPGIAGIALTVGMAVDANIIIFERIREERRLGKNNRSAMDAGFEHALSAVLDANITTGIAGVVLYSYGTGPIKGFAVTLLIGIITTLFTAIFVSRTLLDVVVRKSDAKLGI